MPMYVAITFSFLWSEKYVEGFQFRTTQREGRLVTPTTDDSVDQARVDILSNRRVTIAEVTNQVHISRRRPYEIMNNRLYPMIKMIRKLFIGGFLLRSFRISKN